MNHKYLGTEIFRNFNLKNWLESNSTVMFPAFLVDNKNDAISCLAKWEKYGRKAEIKDKNEFSEWDGYLAA